MGSSQVAFSGSEFVFGQRQRTIRELERMRNEGILAAKQILDLLTPNNIDRVWPLIAPTIDRLLQAQQDAGREAMMAYMSSVGIGLGYGMGRYVVPAAAAARDHRLPSGMPWSRLTSTGGQATLHRIENGLSPVEAVNFLKGQMTAAVADQLHDEARKVAADILKDAVDGRDWAQLDREHETELARIRHDAALAEGRRIRKNMSARGQSALRQAYALTGREPYPMTRYIRVPSPSACSFCLMLATRGAVYYEDSWKVKKTFRKDGNASVHMHCRCVVMPEPSPGQWRHSIIGDQKQYENAVWRDTKYKRTVDIGRFAEIKQVISVGDAQRLRYVLAA